MKKILYVVMILLIMMSVNACAVRSFYLHKYQIGFTIESVSFVGNENDWSHLKLNNVDNLNVKISIKDSFDTIIDIPMPLEYTNENMPKIESEKDTFILDNNGLWTDYTPLNIDSYFKSGTCEDKDACQYNNAVFNATNQYHYALNLKYDSRKESVLDIETLAENHYLIPYEYGFNYKVNYKVIHDGTSDLPKLNLIVMAEGYRADQMDWYKKYVDDAFKDASSFNYSQELTNSHKHYKNKFYEKYWNQIRVIRMDTISPQSGVDQSRWKDDVQSILNYNCDEKSLNHACNFSRIRRIMWDTRPLSLYAWHADAFIIFVNDEKVWAYSYSDSNSISSKYGQPIHPIIIQAPVGYDVNSKTFHATTYYKDGGRGVTTNAIAHELGHALAQLQDEYQTGDSSRKYKSYFRNVDNDTNFKWQKLTDKGYGGGNTYNDLLGIFEGCYYRPTGLYRPTSNSTMGNPGDTQFGPVNMYHMVATFKIRTSKRDPEVKDLKCDENPNNYEWSHYSIDAFHDEWDPAEFK